MWSFLFFSGGLWLSKLPTASEAIFINEKLLLKKRTFIIEN